MFGELNSTMTVLPEPSSDWPYVVPFERTSEIISLAKAPLSTKKFRYGPFASTLESQDSCNLSLEARSDAIMFGAFRIVLARAKHGNAKSPISSCGGISIRRFTLSRSNSVNSDTFFATACLKSMISTPILLHSFLFNNIRPYIILYNHHL